MDEAYLNSIRLDCETISDSFEKSLAIHEFPYSDTARIQDLGQKARTIKLRCWFWGSRYDEHKAILALLNASKALTLEHPAYGKLDGYTRTIAISHNEDAAILDIDFVSATPPPEFAVARDVVSEAEHVYASILDMGRNSIWNSMVTNFGDLAATWGSQSIVPGTSILSQILGLVALGLSIKASMLAWVGKVSGLVGRFAGLMAEITLPVTSLVSTITFAQDLIGVVIGSIAQAAERYAQALSSIQSSPARLINILKDNISDLQNTLFPDGDDGTGIYPVAVAIAAATVGLHAAYGLADDQANRDANEALATASAFDAAGNYVRQDEPAATMNIREIEYCLGAVREIFQAAVDINRDNQALKDMAALLVDHVTQTKLKMEQIISISVDRSTPLHLVCMRNGLSYRDAERILAINSISKPNFTLGEVSIYVQ